MENHREMKVEIVRRENIKPSSPTPPHLKSFKLSLLDQRAPPVYTTLVLFYKTTNLDEDDDIITSCNYLKKSLSEALTTYAPLAGKIDENNPNFVECTDDRAVFVEAKFNAILSTFLEENPKEELLELLLPANTRSPEAATSPLLLVQATFFNCGGLAVGVSMSHKLADAATLCVFLKSWARRGQRFLTIPDREFDPSPEDLWFPLKRERNIEPITVMKAVNKRYVFDKTKIDVLKAKASSEEVKNPTRVEVVTALVWKCAANASRLRLLNSNHNSNIDDDSRYSFLSQLVDVRNRVKPPLPKNTSGNLVGSYVVHVDFNNEQQELELKNLVAKLRKAIGDYSSCSSEKQGRWSREVEELIEGADMNKIFLCNSWCNFGFYEVNFGWGKPIWAWRPSSSIENVLKLMDTRNGGVEVSLTLSNENMALFERDPEILAFSYPIMI
ncbi:BAHD acyltransferase BIA1-like [Humulus lupulus]|uniref:BAHD acyltransferase BIA1-like n=1 Tax=Humulus lupulus TaxID=3486 RepID=UPI002B4114B8|nr:BAHD acyltransferase BIA1-like [Humulus lupulus]